MIFEWIKCFAIIGGVTWILIWANRQANKPDKPVYRRPRHYVEVEWR